MSNSSLPTTTAVILVAGLGARLRPLTDDRPKALMDLGGETILNRALRLLIAAGVRDVVLATGYREDQIKKAVSAVDARITFVKNEHYDTTQNSISLGLCAPWLTEKSFFKLDGDVVFQPRVLERLADSNAQLSVAVDTGRALDEEAMKVRVADGRITAFGKGIPCASAFAETIGIERLDAGAGRRVLSAIDAASQGGDRGRYYEDFYSDLIAAGQLSAAPVDVSDLPWSEVDTFEDLERARAAVLLQSAETA